MFGFYLSMKIIPLYTNTFATASSKCDHKPAMPAFRGNDLPPIPNDSFSYIGNDIDIGRIKNLNIKNLRLINSNSVRGECLVGKRPYVLRELKESGITTVIDLRSEGGENSKYARYCRANGLDYYNVKIKDSDTMFQPMCNQKASRAEFYVQRENFTKQLKTFFKLQDEGHFYMGCLLGMHRTDLAVTTNYLLNPNEPQSIPILSHMIDNKETNFLGQRINCVKNLYNNLTEENRSFLGLPENYSEILSNRIKKLIVHNTKL